MKRKRVIIIIIALLIGAALLDVFVISPRTVRKNVDTENITVFIPKGMANHFHDYMYDSFDDQRVWKYKLSKREAAAIKNELNNGIWKEVDAEAVDEITGVFFDLVGVNKPDNLTQNVYYCIFDDALDNFIDINGDNAILGWHRDLFLYDSLNDLYWCVAMGI